MNSSLPLHVLRLCRLRKNCEVTRRWYCSALKPEFKQAINCFDIMSKNYPVEDFEQSSSFANIHPADSNTSVNQILGKVCTNGFSAPKFCKALKEISMQLLQTETESIHLKNNGRFIEQCNFFVDSCFQCDPCLLISVLRSLLVLNLHSEVKVIEAIENSILEKMDIFDGNEMLDCLVLHCSMNATEVQKHIVKTLLNEIPKRLHQLTTGSVVFKLMKVYDKFDKKTQKRLDFKIAELVNSFNPHYLSKLLCLLAEKQDRNKTVLSSISCCLQDNEIKPDLKQTVDLLYALNTLNYPDQKLILYLTDGRTSEILSTNHPSSISSLLAACGHLRWRHTEILEACSKWIVDHQDACNSREFVSYILTAATLNYLSEGVDATLKSILPVLKEKISPGPIWLDVVWSLSILGYVNKEMLLGVLNKEFYEPLLEGADFRVMTNKLKLMNLKAVLKNKHPEYIFSCDLFLDTVELPNSSEVEHCKRSVVDALASFIPPGKYLRTSQTTDMGITVDAEFVMDKEGKPLPLLEYCSETKTDAVVKVVPQNTKRVAVLVLTYKDYTLNEPHITGIVCLNVELLKAQGYAVVLVPYDEFSENVTAVKKALYLQKQIMKAIDVGFSDKENANP